MNILYRYIARNVIAATALMIVIVMGLILFITFLEELKDIGVGGYGVAQAFVHVLLRLPHHLYEFFPIIVMLGGIIGLGVLAAHQELVVMRTSSISVPKLASAVIGGSVVVILIITLMGEFVAPKANFVAENYRNSAQNEWQSVTTASGVWVHDGNNFLHIDAIIGGGRHLEGVTRYQFDSNHKMLAAYYAKAMDYHHGKWVLHDLVKTIFNGDHTHSEHFSQANWDLNLNMKLLNTSVVAPASMSLKNLAEQVHELKQNGLQAGNFELEFWKRIFQPLTAIVMILLAIPFVLGSSRSVPMGWRVLFGILVGFAFYILNALLGQFSIVFQLPAIFAAAFPTVLFAFLGYVLMVKKRV